MSSAAAAAAGPPGVLEVLRRGEVEVKGRLPWSSNGTFLVDVCLDD